MLSLVQQILNGLTLGGIYALIALGYTMVYGVLKLINFAHGEVFMIGAMTGYFASLVLGFAAHPAPWELVVVSLLAMLVCGLLGMSIERVAYRPLRNSPRLACLITAIGVSLFFQFLFQINFTTLEVPMMSQHRDAATGRPDVELRTVKIVGPERKDMPRFLCNPATGQEFPSVVLLSDGKENVTVRPIDLVILPVTGLMLVALWFLTQRTDTGRAIRAVSYDKDLAALMGINVDRTISLTFFIGSVLAGAAGVLVSCRDNSLDPLMGAGYGLKAFVAAVLGGIGSLPGAALGGVLLGLVESFVQYYVEPEAARQFLSHLMSADWAERISRWVPNGGRWKEAVSFAILIGVLLVRPAGLLGKKVQDKV